MSLVHALETWSDATAQYWASAGRVGQPTLSGKFAKFRMRPVLGETFMPLECVILEGGGNPEWRAWKAFGQWINTACSLVATIPDEGGTGSLGAQNTVYPALRPKSDETPCSPP